MAMPTPSSKFYHYLRLARYFTGKDFNMEFSKKTKLAYLWVKPANFSYQRPGIFGLDNTYILSLWLVLFLELITGVVFVQSFANKFYAVISILVLIALDLFLITLKLIFNAMYQKNSIIWYIREDAESRALASANMSQASTFKVLINIAIFLVALIKSLGYYSVSSKFNIVHIFIVVMYLIIALIHSKVSSYAIGALILLNRIRAEIRRGPESINGKRTLHFYSEVFLVDAQSGSHRIYLLSVENGQKHYVIESEGILFNDDVTNLINAQLSYEAKSVVSKKCTEMQFEILNSEPLPRDSKGSSSDTNRKSSAIVKV